MDINLNIKHEIHVRGLEVFHSIAQSLADLKVGQGIIMAGEQDIIALSNRIKVATDAQGVALATEGDTLKAISDKQDTLLAEVASGQPISPDTIAQLQANADAMDTISRTIQAHADFSNAILANGATTPVPVVPPVTVVPNV